MNIQKCFAKTSSLRYSVAFAVFLFAQHSTTLAAIVPVIVPVTVVKDNLLDFEVTWSLIKSLDVAGLDDGQKNDFLAVPKLTKWRVGLGPDPITLTYHGGGKGWTLLGPLTAQHIVAPHAGEGVGAIAEFNMSFDQLSPTSSTINQNVVHRGQGHSDFYTLTYAYVPANDAFSAKLTGVHPVPIPAAIWLLGSALVGLGVMGKNLAARLPA